jgi:hypothetical protein
MIKIALAALLISAQPATACHRFSVWKYPYPQRCGVTHVSLHAPAPDKSYYVEITATPPDPAPPVKTMPLPAIENIGEPDPRTPEQIADQKEHDAAVAGKKDEINKLMIILKAEEAAKQAVGIK